MQKVLYDNAVIFSTGFDWNDFGGGLAVVISGDPNWFAIDVRSDNNWRAVNLTNLLGEGWNSKEHRYTVVYDDDAKSIKAYVDDVLFYSGLNVTGVNMDSNNTIFAIGCLNKYVEGSENWCGYTSGMTADDVAVFDYALSYAEILGIEAAFADHTSGSAETSDILSVGSVIAVIALCGTALVIGKKKR